MTCHRTFERTKQQHLSAILILVWLMTLSYQMQAQCTWAGGSGNWSDPAKWNNCGGGSPLPTDNVLINLGTSIVTLDVPATVNDIHLYAGVVTGSNTMTVNGKLTLTSGEFANQGNLDVAGDLIWTGGTLGKTDGSVSGAVTVGGLAQINASGYKWLSNKSMTLNGGALFTAGNFGLLHGGTLEIPAGQTFTAAIASGTAYLGGGAAGQIINQGTFVKNGSGLLNWEPPLQHTGSLEVLGGILRMYPTNSYTGSITFTPGSTLQFIGGTHDLSACTVVSDGLLHISGGANVTLPVNSTHADVKFNSGIGNFPGNVSMNNLDMAGGTANLNGTLVVQNLISGTLKGPCEITVQGDMTLGSSAMVGNTGDVTVMGNLNWMLGYIGDNTGTSTGQVTVHGYTTIHGAGRFQNRKTLNLLGGGEFTNGSYFFSNNAVLHIAAGQTFLVNSDVNLSMNGTGAIANYGIVEKQGTGVLSCNPTFNNHGLLKGGSTITFSGGFQNYGSVSPGSAIGTLALGNNLNLGSGQLLIEVQDNSGPGTGHDHLTLNGNPTLSLTTLTVAETGCMPDGDYDILSWTGTRAGDFATLNLPPGASITYDDVLKKVVLHSVQTEICNGIDDDCDGSIDEGVQLTFYADLDGDGFGDADNSALACEPPPQYVPDAGDCDDTNAYVNPLAAEVCDGVDNNCDGLTDDDDPLVEGQITWFADADNDGFGGQSASLISCTQPEGYVANNTDCDDSDFNLNPGVAEVCNGIDDDCDGLVDEGCGNPLEVDAGDCQAVYYGYAPLECATLTAVGSGGAQPYSFAWSNGSTGADIQVCPASSQVYTVTITDAQGNTAQDGVFIDVADVRCGNNKVLMCHNGSRTMCISPNAVPEHLAHGDVPGTCGLNLCPEIGQPRSENKRHSLHSDLELVAYPNPAFDFIEISIHADTPQPGTIQLFDFTGKIVVNRHVEYATDTPVRMETHRLPSGLYGLRWTNSQGESATIPIQVIRD